MLTDGGDEPKRHCSAWNSGLLAADATFKSSVDHETSHTPGENISAAEGRVEGAQTEQVCAFCLALQKSRTDVPGNPLCTWRSIHEILVVCDMVVMIPMVDEF